MESIEQGKAALIAGIETDAANEAKSIIDEADKRAQEKLKYGQKKVDSILAEAEKKGKEQAQAVKRKIISDVDLHIKRSSLHMRDTVIKKVIKDTQSRLFNMIGNPEYRNILFNWVVQAVIGLDAESVQVNASAKELPLLTDKFLSEIADTVKKQTNRDVSLVISKTGPVKSQGVVVTSADGHMAFNNQVETRLARKKHEIYSMIYRALFPEKEED